MHESSFSTVTIIMGIRRPGTKGYEEVEGVNIPTIPASQNANGINNNMVSPEFELASVSVVPDGEFTIAFRLSSSFYFFRLLPFRHIYRCAGGQRIRLWMVPSQAFAVRGPVLDERLDGDDDSIGARAGAALRLGH